MAITTSGPMTPTPFVRTPGAWCVPACEGAEDVKQCHGTVDEIRLPGNHGKPFLWVLGGESNHSRVSWVVQDFVHPQYQWGGTKEPMY